ncbi:integral plasma membrane protein [Dimargaris cristalligena]|uniref:Integral plasma membrane protein n=1 Tax=Dimargaris cristalligena TaxID=215637 RepID=A0A4P9ZKT1_9FUNG|nr:integral plasma membrane protein [Dimargaris cristalligena]|eukprot:RKP33857.1 integral plasma membrane protein [Dimargaris cristalligena]
MLTDSDPDHACDDPQSPATPLLRLPGTWIAQLHTTFAYLAFAAAFAVACYTHYHKIVRNEFFGYPQEWLPSVSATIGDRYPARSIFQILIALTAGPRFLLILLWFALCQATPQGRAQWTPKVLLGVGLVRTVSCGGWVYITSTDDHTTHDVAMITYMLCTLPYMLCMLSTTAYTPLALTHRRGLEAAKKWRGIFFFSFFAAIVPLVYYFIQHKVHHVPGAYSIYAIFEWSLIILDVAFDAVSVFEFSLVDIVVRASAASNKKTDASHLAVLADPDTAAAAEATVRSGFIGCLLSPGLRHFVADSYMAFVFWTLFTALGACIWYFPLWHMGISGYEAFLFITLSPFLLGIGPLRRLIRTHRAIFHALSLVGIAAYMVPDPIPRLLMVSAGTGLSTLTWAATWYESKGPALVGRLDYDVMTWLTGLVFSVIVKAMGRTNNLAWPIMNQETGGWNGVALVLGLAACVDILVRGGTAFDSDPPSNLGQRGGASALAGLASSAGLGSLIFCLHSMYTDSSTISRWVVDGYPNPGPSPVPWGFLIIFAQIVGAMLSPRAFVRSWAWFGAGCVFTAILYTFPGTPGFLGGVLMAAFATSITPLFIQSASRFAPGRTLGLAMFIYCLLVLAHVWVVAYAFVPGGPVLRERTWVVLSVMMALIGLGFTSALDSSAVRHAPAALRNYSGFISRRFTRYQKRQVLSTWAGLLALAFGVMLVRVPTETPAPYHPEAKVLTTAIWTIHFALDNNMWVSERRMINAIRELEIDVIGLLESDLGRIIMGNRDFLQSLAEELNMYTDYGPSPIKHTWGCAMLSKFPIKRSSHHLLPSPDGELACAIYATLDVYGKEVDVIVSHNGQEEDPIDRFLQTTELARIMRESYNPFVFLGYVVTKPHQKIYNILINDGRMHDIDPSDSDRWCQYVAYRGLQRAGYARVSRGTITDTEIQMGKFIVDDNTYNNTAVDARSAQNLRVSEDHYPPALHFPAQFRGKGVRGHFYHVFNEPRYFE